jgi:hypothetical protein
VKRAFRPITNLAKRFSSCRATIILLAVALIGGGCASLRPPALETGDAVEAEVVNTVHAKELEENVPPEPVQTALLVVAEAMVVLGRVFAQY